MGGISISGPFAEALFVSWEDAKKFMPANSDVSLKDFSVEIHDTEGAYVVSIIYLSTRITGDEPLMSHGGTIYYVDKKTFKVLKRNNGPALSTCTLTTVS
jgi:hypothetical protein